METTITLEFHYNNGLLQEAQNNGQQVTIMPTREDDFAHYGYPVYGREVFRDEEKDYPKHCWHVVGTA